MKYIITESKYNNFIDNLLKKESIEVNYQYFSHSDNNFSGTVRLYRDGNILGFGHGYDFFYKFDPRFGRLEYDGHFPKIENVSILKYLPKDETIKYFSDNLVEKIKKDVSYLFER